MATSSRERGLELEPLNLTPLLDILFNLIFFFVLATTLKEQTPVLEVKIPEANSSSTIPQEEHEWVVCIGADGSLFLNDDAVTSSELKLRLTEDANTPEGPLPVRIRSDRSAQAQHLVTVMDVLLESKHPDFYLDVARRPMP